MAVYKKQLDLKSKGERPTYINITDEVKEAIAESGINDGIVTVISPHTTCSVFFEEFCHDYDENGDEYLQKDLNDVLAKIIPDQTEADVYLYPGEKHFEEVETWPNVAEYIPDGDRSHLWNGDAHLKSTLLGSSETFEVDDGKLGVGTTGYIYFVDFDRDRPRPRKCKVIVIGE